MTAAAEPPEPEQAVNEAEAPPSPIHLAQQAAMPCRACVAFPGPPGPNGEATEQIIECYLVRGLDREDTGHRVYHAFGPPGRPLPPFFRPMLVDHDGRPLDESPVGVHIEFEVETMTSPVAEFLVFSEPHQVQRTNN